MNVIFLDIDGVLNHQFAYDKNYSDTERFGLAQDLVDNLKRIIDSVNDAKIVISSSWRSFRSNEFVLEGANWRNVLCNMLGCGQDVVYGDIPTTNEFGVGGAKARALDIKAWFTANNQLNIESFVILDDEVSRLQ